MDCESIRWLLAPPFPMSSFCFHSIKTFANPLHLCRTRLDCSPSLSLCCGICATLANKLALYLRFTIDKLMRLCVGPPILCGGDSGRVGMPLRIRKKKLLLTYRQTPPYLWRKVQLALPTTEKKEKSGATLPQRNVSCLGNTPSER
jgi:hypothetical protein